MSGIIGSLNTRGSGLVNLGSAADGTVFTGTGAGLPVGFEAAAGGGKVLQVQSATLETAVLSSATSFATIAGLSVDITPAATSSEILVFINVVGAFVLTGSVSWYSQIVRDSTVIFNSGSIGSTVADFVQSNTGIHLDDTISTTSQVTYAFQAKGDSGATWSINRTRGGSTVYGFSSITAIEIGA